MYSGSVNRKPFIIPLNENIVKILKEYLTYRKDEMEIYDSNIFNKYGVLI